MSANESAEAMTDVDVVIIGAGLAGLAAGAVAAKAGRQVAVLDAHRPGGRAVTTEQHGVRFNQGPHALYRSGAGWSVLNGLGIDPRGGSPAIDRGSALLAGQLHPLPIRARQLLTTPLLSARSRVQVARVMTTITKIEPATVADRNGAQWLDDLGLRPDARALLAALLRLSSYVADHDLVSADVLVGQLQRSMAGVCYLDRGWQQLVDALTAVIVQHGGTIDAGRAVRALTHDGVRFVAHTDGGDVRGRAAVLAAGGPKACADLWAPTPASWRGLGPDVTAACLDIASRKAPTTPFVLGIDEPTYFSNHCPPADLAPAGVSVLSVMRYRSAKETSEVDRDRRALTDLARRVGVERGEAVASRYLHGMVVVHGLPSPSTGGLAGRPAVAVDGVDGLFVAGDWVGPVGWLADGSLASAEAAGHLAAAHAESTMSNE